MRQCGGPSQQFHLLIDRTVYDRYDLSRMRILWVIMGLPITLFNDVSDDAGADGAAAFPDGEAQFFFQGHGGDEMDFNGDIVAGHDHLHPFRQGHDAGDVGGAQIKLRPITAEKRRMPSAFFLVQDVDFRLELGVRQ